MKKKIMLVDDNRTMLDLLTSLLNLEGYQVVYVSQEIGFFESVRFHEPDLIVMDVHLRMESSIEINGLDLLEKLRSDPTLKDTKIIMVSGRDMREKSKKAGADDFILKPFMPDELTRKIKTLME